MDLFLSNLTIAFRNFRKNKLHAIINITGMAVAITSILLIAFYIQHELSYDRFHSRLNRIVVLSEQANTSEEPTQRSVFPALPALLQEYPALETGTRVFNQQFNWLSVGEKEFEERITFVDKGFFQVFSFPLLKGDVQTALAQPSSIILSDEMAGKLFGKADPIGQVVSFDNGKKLLVSGVLAPIPANSSIDPQVIIPIETLPDFAPWIKEAGDWYNSFTTTFLLLSPTAEAKEVQAQLPSFVKKYFAEAARERILHLEPFAVLHKKQADNSTYILGLSCIALFLLLVAAINFANLSIATSLSRVREVAVRKIIGSTRTGLIMGFLTEACLTSMIALLVGGLAAYVLLPFLNSQLDLRLQPDILSSPASLLYLVCLSLTIGLLAGIYPSFYFTALKPISALKGRMSYHPGSTKVRNGLVVVQFVIAVFLMTGTLLVFSQIEFMKKADLRFNRENVVVVGLNMGFKNEKSARSQINFLLNKLQSRPEVESLSTSLNIRGRYYENYNEFLPEGGTGQPVLLRQTTVDEGYLPTYGIKLIEGRNFSATRASDTTEAILINQAAMQAFGWNTATGKTLRSNGSDKIWQIVGVMNDFHYQSLQGKVEPLVHFFSGPARMEKNNFLSIRVKPQQATPLLEELQQEWKRIPSRKEFSYFFIDEEFAKQYRSVEQSLSLITFFTVVTILIACAGVFAITSLSTHLRSREVGVRKVLGADVTSIIRLFFKEYLKLVLLANLIAWPLVYYAIHLWLQRFAYQTGISPWLFALSGVVMILIAILTISYQTIKAALANPVKSLRNE